MEYGFTRNSAREALSRGWTRDQIDRWHERFRSWNVQLFWFTKTGAESIIFENGFLAYPDQDGEALERAFRARQAVDRGVEDRVVVYCDGSGTTPQFAAGYGVVVEDHTIGSRTLVHARCGCGTNNHAELSAVLRGIQEVPNIYRRVEICSDSAYALGCCMNYDWSFQKNQDLIHRLHQEIGLRKRQISFTHVDGHSGVLGNEIADRLAKAGRTGYQPKFGPKLAKRMLEEKWTTPPTGVLTHGQEPTDGCFDRSLTARLGSVVGP